MNVGEDILRCVLRGTVAWLSECQEGDAAGDDHQHVEDHIVLGHFFHPVCGERVDETSEHGQASHYSHSLACSRLVVEVGSNGDGSE